MKNYHEQWFLYDDMIKRIAADYHRRYSMVETEDLYQEMYLWFASHPRKFKEWSTFPEKEKDRLIAKSLRNASLKYCEKEKARKLGYDLADLYYYDISVLEAFLPTVISESYEIPAKIKDLNFKFGKGEINDGMNWLSLRSDIARAYYRLSEAKQNVLRLRFTDDTADWQAVAKELSTTPDGARMKVQRALGSLTQHLGGWRPFYDEDTKETNADAVSENDTEEY